MIMEVDAAITDAYQLCWGRVIAAAYRITGDLDLAEESAAESFASAAKDWPASGVPRSVEAWLVTAAQRRAIDQLRRRAVRRGTVDRLTAEFEMISADDGGRAEEDEVRFLALCAGDGLSEDTQVLLLLKFGMGVDTATLTEAFHVSRATMAARLTRAKKQLQAGAAAGLDVSVESVLPALHRAIYLIFTLGRVPPTGDTGTDRQRIAYADFLSAYVLRRWPSPDAAALRMMIMICYGADAEAAMLARSIRFGPHTDPGIRLSPLVVQAAIMLEHALPADRDWLRIAELYDVLLGLEPNPTFALGRAVAISYAFGPQVGLADLDDLALHSSLGDYRYLHAARADCLIRLGRTDEAAAAHAEAARLSRNTDEQRWFAQLAGLTR